MDFNTLNHVLANPWKIGAWWRSLGVDCATSQRPTPTFHLDGADCLSTLRRMPRPGEIGPMPLTTYEVFAYGEFIEFVGFWVHAPWTPDNTYSHFVGERVLTRTN